MPRPRSRGRTPRGTLLDPNAKTPSEIVELGYLMSRRDNELRRRNRRPRRRRIDARVTALHGLLGASGAAPAIGDPLPPLWHCLAFLPYDSQRDLCEDGHPALQLVRAGG